MSKTLLVVVFLVVLTVIGAGALFISTRPASESLASSSPTATPVNMTTSENFTGSFLDALSKGQNKQCTFDHVEDGVRTFGTVYVAPGGDRLASDFKVEQTTGSFDGNLIMDNKTVYIWTSLQEQGVKLTADEGNDSIFGKWAENNNTGLSDNSQIDFECQDWVVDNVKFQPPTEVEFVDVSESLSGNNLQATCAACKELPEGEVRTQCLAALRCE